ncbi:MAG: hypothetical protein SFW67_13345 [Myxococcaceae bacterium]|nr:hypothetical protein [Myxococcaceae bacterium]
MRLVMLAVLVVGCGRSDVLADEVSAPGQQPVTVCQSTCTALPSGLETPVETVPSSARPLHWLRCAGCVAVTVEPGLTREVGAATGRAVALWSQATGGLCLALEPEPTAWDEARLQRIHVRWFAASGRPSTTVQQTTSTFEEKTGRMRNALVELDEALSVKELERALVYGLGQALGLGRSADEVRSAMTPGLMGRDTPGPADRTTLEGLYGESPWCER